LYSEEFFAHQQAASRASAKIIVPIIIEVVVPKSVVDVGSGVGTWAAEFLDRGIEITAIDGNHVRLENLQIPVDRLRPADLNDLPPASSIGSFDLAVCLEVAEHLKPVNAERLVKFLTELAPNVLFSAAIPGQGGRGHINEQWQSYWIELFARHSMRCLDIVRPAVWNTPEVRPWYAQNAFLFSRTLDAVRALHFDLVHPAVYRAGHKDKGFRKLIK
jgi:SAM-dependent methyltransferase